MIPKLADKQKSVSGSGRTGFDGLIDYARKGDDHERVDYIDFKGVSSLDTAGAEMAAVSDRARKEPSAAVCHIILSWREDERRLTEAEFKDSVKAIIEALGYEGHQYVAALHRDTENQHLHLIINEVNPNSFFTYRPRQSIYHMHRACRELEEKHGFLRDNGIVERDLAGGYKVADRNQISTLRSLMRGETRVGQYKGDVPYQQWVLENREALGRLIDGCEGWPEANERLANVGLRLAEHKNGLVLMNDAGTGVKLSALNREIPGREPEDKESGLYSKLRLERKFGEEFVGDRRTIERQAEACVRELSEGEASFSVGQVDAWLTRKSAEADWEKIKKAVLEGCVHLKAEKKQPPRLASRETIDSEQRAREAIAKLMASPADKISEAAIEAGIENRRKADKRKSIGMNAEQLAGMKHCLASRISVVIGDPGTGKSFMMLGVKAAVEAGGGRVIGTGPNNVVRDSLKADSIKSYTVDKLLIDIEKGEVELGRQNGMRLKVLIDETGLIDNPKTSKLLEKAVEHDFDLVMIGDPKQIPSVGQGGLFQDIIEIAGHARLKEIVRQKNETQREAVEKMADRDFKTAMELLDSKGLIRFEDTAKESRSALMEQRRADFERDPSRPCFIFSYKNEDCDWFNKENHDLLVSAGKVTDSKKYRFERRTFEVGVGDAIMLTKNFTIGEKGSKQRLTNGMRGVVTATHDDYLEVKFADDELKSPIRISSGPGAKMPVSLAYAGTVVIAHLPPT